MSSKEELKKRVSFNDQAWSEIRREKKERSKTIGQEGLKGFKEFKAQYEEEERNKESSNVEAITLSPTSGRKVPKEEIEKKQRNTTYLRVVFPSTSKTQYPFDYKVIGFGKDIPVSKLILQIQSSLQLPACDTIGLYNVDQKQWLDENLTLSETTGNEELRVVEYRNKADPIDEGTSHLNN
jgi:hypothetical protein